MVGRENEKEVAIVCIAMLPFGDTTARRKRKKSIVSEVMKARLQDDEEIRGCRSHGTEIYMYQCIFLFFNKI